MLFDTHVHLNASQFIEDREAVIKRARKANVRYMNVVGFDDETIDLAIEIAESDPDIYASVGWHPVDAKDFDASKLARLKALSEHPKVVALGEMGLDYHWDRSAKSIQKDVFKQQIALAKEVNLPIIIHNRKSDDDVLEILKTEDASQVGGIMHCYSSPLAHLDDYLAMNFYISLAGPVTFKNAHEVKEVAKHIPLDRLLIETDAPYLAPHPHRGKRNEPELVTLVAKEIANLKGISYDEIVEKTRENAKKLFRIAK